MFIKKLLVPFSNKKRKVDAARLWGVRWNSHHGYKGYEMKPEMEAFPSKTEAVAFSESVKNAFELLKYTGEETHIEIEEMI